jgi:hypothetical protein
MTEFSNEEREARVRARAFQLWQEEGEPENRALEHWDKASELVAIEENQRRATKPNPLRGTSLGPYGEPVEPLVAVENQGEFPTLTDQGEERTHPVPRK